MNLDTDDREVEATEVWDVIGIGFGPANLALAIALAESNAQRLGADRVSALFLEKQADFGWHRGMLIPDATMQVSFLKDLVTPRNPTSDFSFVAYLHRHGRLSDYINLKTLYPYRVEFHDYLAWAAERMSSWVSYGREVIDVVPVGDPDAVTCLEVVSSGPGGVVERHRARTVVLAPGIAPTLPDGVTGSARVWHSSELLPRTAELPRSGVGRFVVVGAGQSAAEAVGYLHHRYGDAEVCAVHRRYGYSPADDSPFANQVFDPEAVDEFFGASEPVRRELLARHRNTNYAVVDLENITDLYRRRYVDDLQGRSRLRMLPVSEVVAVEEQADHVAVTVHSHLDGRHTVLACDAVVYATGYEVRPPTTVLGRAGSLCRLDADGRALIGRDYRLELDAAAAGVAVYVQGNTEQTHGLGSTLLSNVATRAGEIVASLRRSRAETRHRTMTSSPELVGQTRSAS